jgi:hypothetical protein
MAAAAAALSSLLQNPHTQIHQKQGKPQNKKQKKPTPKKKEIKIISPTRRL